MKTKLIIVAGVLVALAATFTASAQSYFETPVKILPTPQKGILKIMYAAPAEQPVYVRFITGDVVFATDKIDAADFPNGFSKKYDLRKVKADNFRVEISSANLAVTYKLNETEDGQTFSPVLEKTTYNHTLVAANR